MKLIQPGTYTSGNGKTVSLSQEDLQKTAVAYDLKLRPAPVVLGHPRDDSPVFGHIAALSFADGWLQGTPGALVPGFLEFAQTAYGGKLSAAFYEPTSPHNPAPGTYYLRHVGATAFPAVDGATFAEAEEGVVEISFSLAGETVSRSQQLAEREAALDRREMLAFTQDLLNSGRKFNQSAAVALLTSLPAEGALTFSVGDEEQSASPRDLLKTLLSSLPKVVEFAEVAGGALPAASADPQEIARRITAYRDLQAAQGRILTFADAASYVQAHPEFQG